MQFTDYRISKLKSPQEGQELYFDDEVKGLGLRVGKSKKIFFVDYYVSGIERGTGQLKRRRSRQSLGSWKPKEPNSEFKEYNVRTARAAASEVKNLAKAGIDAFAKQGHQRARSLSVSELLDIFLERHVKKHLRATTIENYDGVIECHLKPRVGYIQLQDLKASDIREMAGEILDLNEGGKGGREASNRSVVVLKSALSKAVDWGYLEHSPASRIKIKACKPRMRYLSDQELADLKRALDKREASRHWRRFQDGVDAVRLALMTGCRRGELLSMRWENLDLKGEPATWTKPHESTKQGEWEIVPLSKECVTVLKNRRKKQKKDKRPRSAFVFPTKHNPDVPLHDVNSSWAAILEEADIKDFRFHDLRHTFASHMAMQGKSLYVIGKMLGHKNPQTTQRYAKLNTATLAELSESMSAIVRKAVNDNPPKKDKEASKAAK